MNVTSDDMITGTILFKSPLIFTLPSRTNQSEVDTLEINEDTQDFMHDNLVEIAIDADITNHMPVSAYVSILFSKDVGDSTLYDEGNYDLKLGPIALGPATLEGDPAVVSVPAERKWAQTLTEDKDLAVFEQEELFMGVEFVFEGTQERMAKVRPSDYVYIRAHGSARIRTRIPEEEDEKDGYGNGEGGGS